MLQLIDVYKTFPGHFAPTLKGINLTLTSGEFCVLIGSNGSGKSTLIKSISGEHRIDQGKVIINEKDLTNSSLHDRAKYISSVTQNINIGTISEITLLENMVLSRIRASKSSLGLYKSHEKELHALVKELGLGLEQYINSPLSALSGGQRQSIATLMAVSFRPQILLLDEHTSALDPKSQEILMEYTVKQIQKKQITTIMITHNLKDAVSYGDRLIMLHQGQVTLDLKGKSKASLTVEKLLELFHIYEDMSLIQNERGICR